MLLTKRNEYALQAMILLAKNRTGDRLSAQALARRLGASSGFMSKIAQRLAAAGLVTAWRGKGGGLSLARRPERIRVRDIFRAVDGTLRVSQCMEEGRCTHLICPIFATLHKVQDELDREINAAKLSKFVSVRSARSPKGHAREPIKTVTRKNT
ncbi:MAG: Rrf2 family transcriptional regulator [Candidatus Edwardsbacteria bacterium]|nr:Rrf2 family transcriptional regulator [Candidatus Edwardsbacteria bacterium]